MDRPYIICHMVTSLDGKVAGDFLGKDVYSGLIEDYYRIHREYTADGFLCGRVTMEGSLPQQPASPIVYEGTAIARVDYVTEKAPFYGVAIDPHGKLWWNNNVISDLDDGYNGAHNIEVTTENVPDAFLGHLRNTKLSSKIERRDLNERCNNFNWCRTNRHGDCQKNGLWQKGCNR